METWTESSQIGHQGADHRCAWQRLRIESSESARISPSRWFVEGVKRAVLSGLRKIYLFPRHQNGKSRDVQLPQNRRV